MAAMDRVAGPEVKGETVGWVSAGDPYLAGKVPTTPSALRGLSDLPMFDGIRAQLIRVTILDRRYGCPYFKPLGVYALNH